MLSSPVLPSLPSPQPSLFRKGPPSPEGAIPGDGSLWPHTDVHVRDQLVLIGELAAHHLWEESLVRPPGGSPGQQAEAPMPTWAVVPQWVTGKWKTMKDPVSWVGAQRAGAWARCMLPRVTLCADAISWDTTTMKWPFLKHWTVAGTKRGWSGSGGAVPIQHRHGGLGGDNRYCSVGLGLERPGSSPAPHSGVPAPANPVRAQRAGL